MVVRVVVVLLALAGAGYLATQERAARAADALTGAALTTPDPARLDAFAALQRDAQHWNPDRQPALDLAIVEALAGRNAQAARRAQAVTREEPRNARAWTVLCAIARRYDSGLAATACGRLRALAPEPRGSLNRSTGRSMP
ncbi:MAG TPA: hypothetical protein VNS09_20115 [Solirubrobacter sp.]|nr:hypothetical protein [Solirubrobacter sp.]